MANRRCAIVSGSGTGIGQAVAIELAKNGYDVVVHYFHSEQGAMETVAQCRAAGARVKAFQADLSKTEEIDAFFREATDFLGGLDFYVNNSGVTKGMAFEEITEAFFDDLVNTDMKSALFCTQAAARYMIAHEIRGSIVVLTSSNAMMQKCRFTVYGMIKAGLVKMVRHAAIELARYGIRVNSVAPGWTATPRVLETSSYDEVVRNIPMKRMASPEEVAQMALFFDSPAARSITGSTLLADGGYCLLNDDPAKFGL